MLSSSDCSGGGLLALFAAGSVDMVLGEMIHCSSSAGVCVKHVA